MKSTQMRRSFLNISGIASLLVMAVSIGWAATNLNASRSNIYREFPGTSLVTASATLSGPSETETVMTTPATGDFILTQFCSSDVNGGIRLAAAGLGGIAHTSGVTALCYTFTPGVSLPRNSAITCSTSSGASPGSYFCMITGLQG